MSLHPRSKIHQAKILALTSTTPGTSGRASLVLFHPKQTIIIKALLVLLQWVIPSATLSFPTTHHQPLLPSSASASASTASTITQTTTTSTAPRRQVLRSCRHQYLSYTSLRSTGTKYGTPSTITSSLQRYSQPSGCRHMIPRGVIRCIYWRCATSGMDRLRRRSRSHEDGRSMSGVHTSMHNAAWS